ncbi:cytochrome c oxidase subunit II [Microbacterium mitrae]|uniref:cytochrome-c oxidase n=1 Tax=Microbacterium mitrae TaxID=664640 RepID=A0A5C8HMV5_9MICO|nr:cytochrome c oxidase subunit II [Microbacterium mitrae]TXK04777.1 cytochrome c oxidase subunit II [Microbacterium mitrae]
MSSKRHLRWAAVPVGAATAVALAGCTPQEQHGFLPGFTEDGQPATNHTDMVGALWVNSWIVLLIVGVITWGLMLWAGIAYRRRKGQTGLPVQMRYNMPIEIFYTIVPLILVAGFFTFTARDQEALETQYEDPDVSIIATGKQWAWDFEYLGTEADGSDSVWTMGVQVEADENGNRVESELPTLVLPVNKTVKLQLESRDVIHSFWIIDFLYKKDMYIGHENYWSFTPTREGSYAGKCAELCGEYHSMMLFNVEVVSEAEYEEYLASLEALGQTGPIQDEYDRLQNPPGVGAPAAKEEETH